MRKIFMFLGMALIGLVVSCSQHEDLFQNNEESSKVSVSFDVADVEMTPLTKGNNGNRLRFIMEVWSKGETPIMVKRIENLAEPNSTNSTFLFDLESQGQYSMLLWADYVDAAVSVVDGHYTDKYYATNLSNNGSYNGLKKVKTIVGNNNDFFNNEGYDAFFCKVDFEKTELELQLPKQTLTRAVGKMIIKEKNAAAFALSASSSLDLVVPETFDVENNKVGTNITLSGTDIEIIGDSEKSDYTLFFCYIFAPNQGYVLPEITVRGKNNINAEIYEKKIPANTPIYQNKRTIVSGSYMLIAPAKEGTSVSVDTSIDGTWGDDVEWDIENPNEPTIDFEGEGTEANPYKIGTPEDLMNLANLVNSGNQDFARACYQQVSDIVFDDPANQKINIGTSEFPFTGVFDGNSFKLNMLNSSSSSLAYCAMFGVVENAKIKNVRIIKGKNIASAADAIATSGICGASRGNTEIIGCHYNIAMLKGTNVISAICGKVENGILNIIATKVDADGNGSINGTYKQAGGFIGVISNGATVNITDSYNLANVKICDSSENIGGLCGLNEGGLTITRSYVKATFEATGVSGTFVGQETGFNLEDCFWNGSAKDTSIFKQGNRMGANSWPEWDVNTTNWKDLGAKDEDVYPTLDWE